MIVSLLKYVDYFVALPLLARLPVQTAYWCCGLRGWIQLRMRGESRKHAQKNMIQILPSLDSNQVKRLVLEHFQVKARDELEAFWYSRPLASLLKFVRVEGLDELRNAYARGKGVLYFSGHLGSPGLCGTVIGKHGIPVNIIARSIEPEENPLHPAARRFNRKKVAWIEDAVGRDFVLAGKGNYPRIRELLKAGEVVMILIDVLPQTVNPRRTVPVQFLAQTCLFADGVASLYRETEASLVYWTICRNRRTGLQEIEIRDVTEKIGRQSSNQEIVQQLADLVEKKIRMCPEHWHIWDSVELYRSGS